MSSRAARREQHLQNDICCLRDYANWPRVPGRSRPCQNDLFWSCLLLWPEMSDAAPIGGSASVLSNRPVTQRDTIRRLGPGRPAA
jgi:hypothetical protein